MAENGSFKAPFNRRVIVDDCLRMDNCQYEDQRQRDLKKALFGIQEDETEV